MKTMAIRLEDDTSAQLSVLAQLEATTVAHLIRQAIDTLIADKSANPDTMAKATQVLEAIEEEASAKRRAIQSLLPAAAAEPEPPAKRPARKATEG